MKEYKIEIVTNGSRFEDSSNSYHWCILEWDNEKKAWARTDSMGYCSNYQNAVRVSHVTLEQLLSSNMTKPNTEEKTNKIYSYFKNLYLQHIKNVILY